MSELKTQWIQPLQPSNPNVPDDTGPFPIHPISNMGVGTIPSVLVFPGKIDPDKLIAAVQEMSKTWPNLFGRYEQAEKADVHHGGLYQASCPI
jgi:hypothetical protein